MAAAGADVPGAGAAPVAHRRRATWSSRCGLRGVGRGGASRGGVPAAGAGAPRAARTASACTSCPAACASASRSPGRWPRTRHVLLMDEPFAALDAITRDVLHEELTRVWAETQISVVFVTHNVREAVRLGQRVVLMCSRPGPHRAGVAGRRSRGQRRIESPGVSALAARDHRATCVRRSAAMQTEHRHRGAPTSSPRWRRGSTRSTLDTRTHVSIGTRLRRTVLPPVIAIAVVLARLAAGRLVRDQAAVRGAVGRSTCGTRSPRPGATEWSQQAIWTSLSRGIIGFLARHRGRDAARPARRAGSLSPRRDRADRERAAEPAVGRLGARRHHLVRSDRRRDLLRHPPGRGALDRERPGVRHRPGSAAVPAASDRCSGHRLSPRLGTCCCRRRCRATSRGSSRAGRSPGAR